jgi:APA family basic amino acid/polyamine antiporter
VSLQRRLGVADLTLISIGAVIGSGIFRNPAVVAQRAHAPELIVGCWVAGGILALIGAFVFAELASRHPVSGGLYAYLRDAFHPVVAFIFGWTALLIADTGGTAASAVLFSGYFVTYIAPIFNVATIDTRLVAVVTLAIIGGINLLGVRQGSTWQNILVALKVTAIVAVIAAGLLGHPAAPQAAPLAGFASTGTLLGAVGFAMLPVLFAYNGFQGATYLAAETIQPERTLPRGLIAGVSAVVVIYVLVNIGCIHILGAGGLAATKTPAADVLQASIGPIGGRIVAIAIAISTLGFMSTRMLLAPRIYFQMAADGTFFKQLAWISPRTHVPMVAIALQTIFAAAIAASGAYDQIVNWVTGPEWLFIMLAACALFVFRRRDKGGEHRGVRVPGHPYTTALLIVTILAVFVAEFAAAPKDTIYGITVLASGALFYYLWQRMKQRTA